MVEKKPDCVEAKDNDDVSFYKVYKYNNKRCTLCMVIPMAYTPLKDSPLFVAVRSHHAEAAMYLIKNGAKVTPKEFFIIVLKGYK